MFVTAMMVSFFFALNETRDRQRNILLALCGASCGMAFLTKGFLAFALPAAGIIPYLAWERRIKEIFRLAWLPAIAAIAVILPWAILIHIREGEFWFQFFWIEHIRRFFAPLGKAQHAEPFWFFLPVLAAGVFPWLLLLPAAAAGIWQKGFSGNLTRFAACWFLSFFLVFSASTGKLGTYILPCFPPLMFLVVEGLLTHLQQGRSKLVFGTAVILAILMAAASLFLVTSQNFECMDNMRVYWDEEVWKWRFLAAGFAVFSIFALLAANEINAHKQVALYAMTPLVLFLAVHFTIPETFRLKSRECMNPVGMIEHYAAKLTPDSVILADSYLAPAICWACKRTDIFLYETGGEMSYGLKYREAEDRLIRSREFRYFLELTKGPVTFMTDYDEYLNHKPLLPKPFYIDITNGFVFAQYRHKENTK